MNLVRPIYIYIYNSFGTLLTLKLNLPLKKIYFFEMKNHGKVNKVSEMLQTIS